jgi:hypothetical protein
MEEGDTPRRAKLDMDADPVCTAKHLDMLMAEDGEVSSNGTLPDAFVYLKDASGTFKPPHTPAMLDQSGCICVPHVVGVMVGQPLRIISSDATTHNIHFVSTQNPDWNQSQPPGAAPLIRKFMHPEIMIKVHCNQHPWMSSYIAVTSNPFYAVTGMEGTFTIVGVPPGDYTLDGWTATFGTQDQKVTVRVGQPPTRASPSRRSRIGGRTSVTATTPVTYAERWQLFVGLLLPVCPIQICPIRFTSLRKSTMISIGTGTIATMEIRSRQQTLAIALAISPLGAMIPVIHLASFGPGGFATVWPVAFFAPVAMWMETRSLKLLLATCQNRRDPFFIAAVPIGIVAVAAYASCATLFAFIVPALIRLIL